MKHIPRGFLLDVDGTITNPQTKQLEERSIVHSLTQLLTAGEIIGFNTGRSPRWVVNRVIVPLRRFMGEDVWKTVNSRIVVMGGKGTIWVGSWGQDGAFEEGGDQTLMLPQDFRNAMKKLTDEFSRSMSYDTTKTTLVTAEMLDGYDVSEFAKDQKEYVSRLRQLVIEHSLEGKVRIDLMRISIDVQPIHAGKGLGAKQTIRLLKDRGFVVDGWIVIGDSPSDYAAPEYLADHGLPVRFVYVGDIHDFDSKKPPFPIEGTDKPCDKGTAEFLKEILKNSQD
jgi:hypothetical protein